MVEIQSQTRKTIGPGQAPVGLVVGAELRDIKREASRSDQPHRSNSEHPTRTDPVEFGCFTFGPAQYSSANRKLTTKSSTGHLAISQTSIVGVAEDR